jgi:hypothetical protein
VSPEERRLLLRPWGVIVSMPQSGLPLESRRDSQPKVAFTPAAGNPGVVVDADPGSLLLHELAARFAGTFSDGQILTYVQNAINDLRGSVRAEALPEMAARLAHHRLSVGMRPEVVHDEQRAAELAT